MLIVASLGLFILPGIPPVYAGNNVVFDFATGPGTSDPSGGIQCGGGCTGIQGYAHAVSSAELIVWEVVGPAGGGLTCSSLSFSDSQTDALTIQGCTVIQSFFGNGVQALVTGFTTSAGTVTFRANSGASNVQYYIIFIGYKFVATVTGFNSVQKTGIAAGSDNLAPTVPVNFQHCSSGCDLLLGSFTLSGTTSGGTGPITQQIGTVRSSASFTGLQMGLDDVAASPFDQWFFGTSQTNTENISHMVIDMSPGFVGDTNFVTQCFGNCGNPAVTLANTNSTHTVNFNQSITLFYFFQTSLNGYVNNVTVNLAKNYPDGLHAPFIALYFANCPIGTTPFTSACPGLQQSGVSSGAFNKGRVTLTGGFQYVVTSRLWVGIAVSSQFSGMDLNDTNTGVLLSQTTGLIPSTISQYTTQNPSSLVGIWAFVTGASTTSPPPPATGPCVNNFAQLDCLLPAMTNGMCAVLTASCQTSGSLFWVVTLTFVSFLLVTVGFASAHVSKFVAAGDVFMFFFLAWFFIFAGMGLIQSFVIIFFLFIGAVAFGKTARSYF